MPVIYIKEDEEGGTRPLEDDEAIDETCHIETVCTTCKRLTQQAIETPMHEFRGLWLNSHWEGREHHVITE